MRRSQPGLLTEIGNRVAQRSDLMTAIEDCGRELIKFVYRTVEQTRRRSLREMWLAAHGAARSNNPNQELRRRILDYMTEGDATPVMLRLSEMPHFRFSDWISAWVGMESEADAREWRAAAARLLGSYPSHPGLLVSRALPEVLLADGDPSEFESNLREGFQSARSEYQADEGDTLNAVQPDSRTRDGRAPTLGICCHRRGLLCRRVRSREYRRISIDPHLARWLAHGSLLSRRRP